MRAAHRVGSQGEIIEIPSGQVGMRAGRARGGRDHKEIDKLIDDVKVEIEKGSDDAD